MIPFTLHVLYVAIVIATIELQRIFSWRQANPFLYPITDPASYEQAADEFVEDVRASAWTHRPSWIAIGPYVLRSIGAHRRADLLARINAAGLEDGWCAAFGRDDGNDSLRFAYDEVAP